MAFPKYENITSELSDNLDHVSFVVEYADFPNFHFQMTIEKYCLALFITGYILGFDEGSEIVTVEVPDPPIWSNANDEQSSTEVNENLFDFIQDTLVEAREEIFKWYWETVLICSRSNEINILSS